MPNESMPHGRKPSENLDRRVADPSSRQLICTILAGVVMAAIFVWILLLVAKPT